MSTQNSSGKEKENNKDAAVKPDQETINTTDPQEHMKGPLSSLMHGTGEDFENEKTGDGKTVDKDD